MSRIDYGPWKMWALDDPTGLRHPTPKAALTRLYGEHPVVSVLVEECSEDDATHWGWLETDAEFPSMIWPAKMLVEMCFTYGSQPEIDRGRGALLSLHIEAES